MPMRVHPTSAWQLPPRRTDQHFGFLTVHVTSISIQSLFAKMHTKHKLRMREGQVTQGCTLLARQACFSPSTAEIHMKHKLRMSEDQVTQAVIDAITYLRSLGCSDIEFTPEDAGGWTMRGPCVGWLQTWLGWGLRPPSPCMPRGCNGVGFTLDNAGASCCQLCFAAQAAAGGSSPAATSPGSVPAPLVSRLALHACNFLQAAPTRATCTRCWEAVTLQTWHLSGFILPGSILPISAGRSDPRYLYEVLGEAIKAGATTLNITDTVGYCLPHEFLVRRHTSQDARAVLTESS